MTIIRSLRVLDVLAEEGFIRGYTRVDHKDGLSEIEIELKYGDQGRPAIRDIERAMHTVRIRPSGAPERRP